MGMFTVCFDTSGDEKQSDYVVVAGFLSSARDWIKFSAKWQKLLDREKIEYFRASELQSYEGQFKSWKLLEEAERHRKRSGLWCDALDIIESNVYRKFGCSIRIPEYKTNLSAARLSQSKLNAYVMCAYVAAEEARLWAKTEHICSPLEYVFEEGDIGWGALQDYFKIGGLPPPIPRPKKNTERKGLCYPAFLPLQAADFIAHENSVIRKIISQNRHGKTLFRPLMRFHEMKGRISRFSEDGLKRLDHELNNKPPVKVNGV